MRRDGNLFPSLSPTLALWVSHGGSWCLLPQTECAVLRDSTQRSWRKTFGGSWRSRQLVLPGAGQWQCTQLLRALAPCPDLQWVKAYSCCFTSDFQISPKKSLVENASMSFREKRMLGNVAPALLSQKFNKLSQCHFLGSSEYLLSLTLSLPNRSYWITHQFCYFYLHSCSYSHVSVTTRCHVGLFSWLRSLFSLIHFNDCSLSCSSLPESLLC